MLRRKETALCFPLRLTPGGKSYVRELSITNIGAGSRVAAWIETDRHRDKVCWRVIRPDGLGRIVSADPVQGAPASPQVFGSNLVWLELDRAKGTLLYAELDIDGESMGIASPVKPLHGINCGDFSCALDSSGTLWLLVETWFREYVTLRLLAYTENEWEDYGPLMGERGFRVRPRLVAGNNGLMAAWDEFIHGTYRVVTAELSGEKPVFRGLPAPNDCWETLSAIVCAGDGTWYAARCREKLVELKGGMASYHSELVVSALTIGAEKWRDIASVDIDHTMNPFVPYVGKRRFPKLLGDGHGAWLLWEEKENFYQIFYLVAKKDIIEQYRALLKELDYQINNIDADFINLHNLIEFLYGKKSKVIIDWGYSKIKVLFCDTEFPIYSRELSNLGLKNLEKNIIKELRIDPDTAESLMVNPDRGGQYSDLKKIYINYIKETLDEIDYTIKFVTDKFKISIETIFLVGGGARIPNICEIVKDVLKIETEVLKIENKIKISDNIDPEYMKIINTQGAIAIACLLYTSPSPRDLSTSRMPSSA